MFLRKASGDRKGKKQIYLEVIPSTKTRSRKAAPVARLGPLDLPPHTVDRFIEKVTEFCEKELTPADDLSIRAIGSWGPLLAARRLWEETGIGDAVATACGDATAEAAFVLAASRLVDPAYEYGLDRWVDGNRIPAADGSLLDVGSLARHVRGGGAREKDFWDAVLRRLSAKRASLEPGIAEVARRFCGEGEPAFLYELSSAFVEGASSRRHFVEWPDQERRRSIRLFFGVVLCGGWPLGFRFFGASEPAASQLRRAAEEAQRRFGVKDLILVLPSGTEDEKLDGLRALGVRYLVGVRRRRDPRGVEVMREAGQRWVRLDSNTRVQEVLLPPENAQPTDRAEELPLERYFLVHGAEEEREERATRAAVVRRALGALEQLKQAVESGRVKKPPVIIARVERILGQRKAYRYLSWRLTPEGKFLYWEDKRKSAVQRDYEGVSVLRTNDPNLSPSAAVFAYQGLRRLADAYSRIYDTLPSRSSLLPLPDLEEASSQSRSGTLFAGHLLATELAFLLRCRFEKRLQENGIEAPMADAIEALRTVSLAKLRIGDTDRFLASPGNRTARRILRALDIERAQPASPSSSPPSRR